jgi:hypothetical protein
LAPPYGSFTRRSLLVDKLGAWPKRLCDRVVALPLCRPCLTVFESERGSAAPVVKEPSTMRAEMRPAIPSTLPEVMVPRARRDRLLRWFAAALTVLAATVAVVGAAMTAVMLGIT